MENTSPEWQKYYADLKAHQDHCEKTKPKRKDYRSDDEFTRAQHEWDMKFFCDAPNKPGYYRANND